MVNSFREMQGKCVWRWEGESARESQSVGGSRRRGARCGARVGGRVPSSLLLALSLPAARKQTRITHKRARTPSPRLDLEKSRLTRARAPLEDVTGSTAWACGTALCISFLSVPPKTMINAGGNRPPLGHEMLRQYKGYLSQANETVVRARVVFVRGGPGRPVLLLLFLRLSLSPAPLSARETPDKNTTGHAAARALHDDRSRLAPWSET